MKPTRAPLALLLLAACGDTTAPVRACDRIGTTQRDYHLEYGSVPDAKTGDIDNDGDPDIVLITADPPALHTLTSDNTRTLRDGPTLALAGRPQGLWIGQLDADDSLDAVVASAGEGTITVITDNLSRAVPITIGVDLSAVTVADFNGDLRLDIIATDRGDAALYLALADGDRFAAPRRFATGLAPWTVAATDLATGALTPLWTAARSDEPAILTVADLDHDGHDDLAVIPRSFAPVQLLWGGPERTLLGPTIEILLADLEGDGHADILRTSDHNLNVTLRAPTGDDRVQLTFNPTWSVLRAADLDDDDILDLIGLRNGGVTTRLSAPQ